MLVICAASAWSVLFGWLAIARHLAGGSHAEDLGFTDQVIWNFLRGQWFRMSLYQGATWNTEIDIAHLARPDSLLAFHFEPMLLGFVPLYALGAGPVALLAVQALAVGLGAIPAYHLGQHYSRSQWAGVAVAGAYLLSPLDQWAVLSDFHTSTLAAPLLVLAAERILVAHRPGQGITIIALALSAREDVGPTVAVLGISLLVLGAARRVSFGLVLMSILCTVAAAGVLAAYSGGASPFGERYAASLGQGLPGIAQAITRPETLSAFVTTVLSGAWLGLLAPAALLPALPALASNTLSASPWMAAGKAHYSGLILPFVVIAAAAGLRRLRRHAGLAAAVLLLTSSAAYLAQGAGPLAANYAPATITAHAQLAQRLAAGLPPSAAVSASSTLAPHLSHRPRLYVFPAVLDAEYVFLDLRATSAPTSPGDVFLRIRDRLARGGWEVAAATDGLLLLHRNDAAPALSVEDLPVDWLLAPFDGTSPQGELQLLHAELVPSPVGSIDVDGPRAILRTTWRANTPLPPGTRLEFVIDLQGEQRTVWDVAALWWYPPERWLPGQVVSVDISDVPARRFLSWSNTR
ncbi:MAG TPA: DUF2079 domain-containing protein [Chloroflexota bacterium]